MQAKGAVRFSFLVHLCNALADRKRQGAPDELIFITTSQAHKKKRFTEVKRFLLIRPVCYRGRTFTA